MKSFKQYYLEEKYGLASLAALGVVTGAMAAPPKAEMPQIERLMTGLGTAEHRGVIKGSPLNYDPKLYIRTKADAKSSAYGPFQLTRSTIQDLSSRHKDMFTGSEDYVKRFVEQGKKMGPSVTTDPTYGLGGKGDLSGEENHPAYIEMTKAAIASKARDVKVDLSKPLSPEDETKVITAWRGMKPEASYVAAYNKGVAGMKSAPKPTTPTKAPQQPTTVSPQPTPTQQVPSKAPVAAPTQAPAPSNTHQVAKGDTLGAIAKKYGKSVEDIQKLNPDIKDPNAIKPGQKIKTK